MRFLLPAVIVWSVAAAYPVQANEEDRAGVRSTDATGSVYYPDDFRQFAPRTALDMVSQIPGFSLQESEERRGFGQAGGNVLVNGRRISGKGNDAIAALGRSPASEVVRIEVVDATTLDIPGLSGRVANIITSSESREPAVSFAWRPEFSAELTEPALSSGEVSFSGQNGKLSYTVGLQNENDRTGFAGMERVFGPSGDLVDMRDEYVLYDDDRPRISGTFRFGASNGAIANLNLSYERYRFRAIEESPRNYPESVPGLRTLRDREDEWNYEVGADYEFSRGPGRLKLIALHRFDNSPVESSVRTDHFGAASAIGSRFTRASEEGESILRTEYGWKSGAADWQLSLEGAYNSLNTTSRLFVLESDEFHEVPLPGGTAMVEEWRSEINATYGRAFGSTLSLQASLGAEFSHIGQSGSGAHARKFVRPKGFVSIAYVASPRLGLTARVEREVGQLNFSDFIASVNLNAGNANVANPDLVPPQSWNVEAEATRTMDDLGAITGRAYVRFISDIVDQIPIGTFGEAPGNLESATVYGLDLTSTFTLDRIGWRGAKIDARIQLQRSRLTDPLTGNTREITRSMRRRLDLDIRHDVPGTDWAWGVEFDQYRQSHGIRIDEIQYFVNDPFFMAIFVEDKDVLGLTVRGEVRNLHGAQERLNRTVFRDRRDGPPAFTEIRERDFGPIFAFTITGSF